MQDGHMTSRQKRDAALAGLRRDVGRSWAGRFQVGRPMHVVKRPHPNLPFVMLCTGSQAVFHYTGFVTATVTCEKCRILTYQEITA